MQKKILYVATVVSHIKSFHLPYLKMMKDNGYKTFVAANWNIDRESNLDYCDKFYQISIQRSPYSFKNIKAIKELKILIEKEKFDIIHCHTPMGAVVARLAAKKARKKYGTKVIYTAHGFHFFDGAPKKNWILFYPVEWYLSKYTDILVTINKEDYTRAKNCFSKRCKNIEYVPGVGIDKKKFDFTLSKSEKQKLLKSFGLNDNSFILIFTARLDRNKNQKFLIDVMSELIKDDKNIHLLLPGKDELNGFYQNETHLKGLDNNIHFLGYRSDVPQLMKISDVAVSSSLREGLPVNVMEAFAAGIPVVALKCRGMEDLISNKENGFCILKENIAEFKDKIIFFKNNQDVYNKICINNKQKSNEYDVDYVVERIKNIYKI